MPNMRFAVLKNDFKDSGEVELYVPDLPEIVSVHSDSTSDEELKELANDAVLTALSSRIKDNDEVPEPSLTPDAAFYITLDPLVSLKLALYKEMVANNVSRRDLGKRLNKSEGLVSRMLDVDHQSKVDQLQEALLSIGKRFVLSVEVEAA